MNDVGGPPNAFYERKEPLAADELAEVVASGNFASAYNLADAAGQRYRAAILAEAARAHHRESPSEWQEPIDADDFGSVLLRYASLLRVALYDRDARARVRLAELLPTIEPFAALTVLAEEVIDALAVGDKAGAEASEQAVAIALWADKVDQRQPRPKRHLLGPKERQDPNEPIRHILRLVAKNDSSQIDEVRERCASFRREWSAERATGKSRHQLHEEAAPNSSAIDVPRASAIDLARDAAQIVAQASVWCDAAEVLASASSSSIKERLAADSRILLPQISAELDYLVGDTWLEAAAQAAKASIYATLDLVLTATEAGKPLSSEPIDRDRALAIEVPSGVAYQPVADSSLPGFVSVDPPWRETLRANTAAPASSFEEAIDSRVADNDEPTRDVTTTIESKEPSGLYLNQDQTAQLSVTTDPVGEAPEEAVAIYPHEPIEERSAESGTQSAGDSDRFAFEFAAFTEDLSTQNLRPDFAEQSEFVEEAIDAPAKKERAGLEWLDELYAQVEDEPQQQRRRFPNVRRSVRRRD